MVEAARRWAAGEAVPRRALKAGYFGSYARGDWGVGSDLDLIAVVADDPGLPPFEQRAADWDLTRLPVPADLLVYTQSEWRELLARDDRFARTMREETVWLVERPSPASL